jgi:hypothetical protein
MGSEFGIQLQYVIAQSDGTPLESTPSSTNTPSSQVAFANDLLVWHDETEDHITPWMPFLGSYRSLLRADFQIQERYRGSTICHFV